MLLLLIILSLALNILQIVYRMREQKETMRKRIFQAGQCTALSSFRIGNLHLGTLRKLHTKYWSVLSSEYAAPIWHPYHETQIGQVEKVQRTAARWTCRRWRNNSSVGEMLDELELPSLETRRKQSSLAFFYKIHSGTASLDKDKYLTLDPN